jgi:myo-inositol-hexaphosphate 3-phosphohydrolase
MVNRALARRVAMAAALWLSLSVVTTVVLEPQSHAAESPQLVGSDLETAPVLHSCDAMDDPAVWVHPTEPSRSLVIGNDKGGGLETYDLDGTLVQRLAFGTQFWGNVDVRQDVVVNGIDHDLVGVVQQGVRFYNVDPDTRLLSPVTEGGAPIGVNGEGFCLYRSPVSQKVYGISITIAGIVNEFELTDTDADGLLESRTVRTFAVGSESEGCVADDDTGALYISEENVALWRYSAEPGGGTARTAVDVLTSAGGHLINDIEGVTLVHQPDGTGYLIVSAQGGSDPSTSYFAVYRREGGNDFVKTVRIVDGVTSDDCDHTDGVTALAEDLGPAFPQGMFVCQDNNNDAAGTVGNQDLKMVRLEKVVDLDGAPSTPPDPGPGTCSASLLAGDTPITFVGRATRNTNATSFTLTVPTSVQPGDLLLLFVSQSYDTPLSGLGARWTPVGQVADGEVTTVWTSKASTGDAGSTLRLSSGTAYVKVALVLAAYRGTDALLPLARISGAPEPTSTTAHTAPAVLDDLAGTCRVSFWSDKNSATTGWTAPAGETVRALTVGAGGGRVSGLLTDAAGPLEGVPSTTTAGTAVATAPTGTATMWTLLLRPSS